MFRTEAIKYISISIEKQTFATPNGNLTKDEIEKSNLPFGRYTGHDHNHGPVIIWHLPDTNKDTNDYNQVYWALANLNDFIQLEPKYQQIIQQDPLVKWNLIPFIFLYKEMSHIKKFKVMAEAINESIFTDIYLFQKLVEYGAEYKHMIEYAYTQFSADTLELTLRLLPRTASEKYTTDGSLLLSMISHPSDKDYLVKSFALLKAGADINDLVQHKLNYNLLLQLIHLNMEDRAIELINICESISQDESTEEKKSSINFLHQDSYGRTALHHAIGHDMQRLVRRLFECKEKFQTDIGINAADQAGQTPLMLAAALGCETAISLLIKHGANINACDKNDKDILYYAHTERKQVRTLLKSFNIEPDVSYQIKNQPYIYSSSTRHHRIMIVDAQQKAYPLLLSTKPRDLNRLTNALKIAEQHRHSSDLNKTNIQQKMLALKPGNKTTLQYHLEQQQKTRELIEQCALNTKTPTLCM